MDGVEEVFGDEVAVGGIGEDSENGVELLGAVEVGDVEWRGGADGAADFGGVREVPRAAHDEGGDDEPDEFGSAVGAGGGGGTPLGFEAGFEGAAGYGHSGTDSVDGWGGVKWYVPSV